MNPPKMGHEPGGRGRKARPVKVAVHRDANCSFWESIGRACDRRTPRRTQQQRACLNFRSIFENPPLEV